jgi:phosphoglycolate phosphatase
MGGSIKSLAGGLFDSDLEWLAMFDIDGTLLDTGGAGLRALGKTAAEIFERECPPLDLAGSTDLGILEYLCSHFNTQFTQELAYDFFSIYHENLESYLSENKEEGRVLDGVFEVLDEISRKDHAQIALLTGNTMSGAAIKLRHFGLDAYFSSGAFGSDRSDRNELGWIALERAIAVTGRRHSPELTIVIGDTPKDIACAHAFGARCLAVATGRFSEMELKQAGGDWVIATLRDLLVKSS